VEDFFSVRWLMGCRAARAVQYGFVRRQDFGKLSERHGVSQKSWCRNKTLSNRRGFRSAPLSLWS
jgi:hypothetical protein